MRDQLVATLITIFHKLGVVDTGQAVQRNTDLEIVIVADIEETLHAYFGTEVSESFRGPVPFVKRIFWERRLQSGALRRLRPIPGFERDAKHKRNASIIRPFYRMFSHGDPFTIENATKSPSFNTPRNGSSASILSSLVR